MKLRLKKLLLQEEKSRQRRAAENSKKSSKPKAAPKTEAVTELGDDNFKAQLKKSKDCLDYPVPQSRARVVIDQR